MKSVTLQIYKAQKDIARSQLWEQIQHSQLKLLYSKAEYEIGRPVNRQIAIEIKLPIAQQIRNQ